MEEVISSESVNANIASTRTSEPVMNNENHPILKDKENTCHNFGETTNPEDKLYLSEFAPLSHVLTLIPPRAQKLFVTTDITLTCVDAAHHYLAMGSNIGIIYFYNRSSEKMLKLRLQVDLCYVTHVKMKVCADYTVVAAGTQEGLVTVFHIPPTDNENEMEKYSVQGFHTSDVSALEWCTDGRNLLSGDSSGLVVCTEFLMQEHMSRSRNVLKESHGIVQLVHFQSWLIVSTTQRCVLSTMTEASDIVQVGQQDRKVCGEFGATVFLQVGRFSQPHIYTARPGLRLWKADTNGKVLETILLKTAATNPFQQISVLSSRETSTTDKILQSQFKCLLVYDKKFLLTWTNEALYVIDPISQKIAAGSQRLYKVVDVATCKKEIFILQGSRHLIRVAPKPDDIRHNKENHPDSAPLVIPQNVQESSEREERPILDWIKSKPRAGSLFSSFAFGGKDRPRIDSVPQLQHDATEKMQLPPIQTLANINLQIFCDDTSISNSEYQGRDGINGMNLEIYPENLTTNKTTPETPEDLEMSEDLVYKHRKRKKKDRKKTDALLVPKATDSAEVESSSSEILQEQLENHNGTIASSFHLSVTCDKHDKISINSDSSELLPETEFEIENQHTDILVNDSSGTISEQHIEPLITISSSTSDAHQTLQEIDGEDSCEEALKSTCSDNSLRPPQNNSDDSTDGGAGKELVSHLVYSDMVLTQILNKFEEASIHGIIPFGEPRAEVTDEVTDEAKGLDCEEATVDELESLIGVQQDSLSPTIADNSDIMEDVYSLRKANEEWSLESPQPLAISSQSPPLSARPTKNRRDAWIKSTSAGTADKSKLSEYDDNWVHYNAPGTVVSLAFAKNYLCCCTNAGSVHFTKVTGPGLSWSQVRKTAYQIAVSPSGNIVWCLHSGIVNAAITPDTTGPYSHQWKEVAQDVSHIAVDDDSAWYINICGEVFTQQRLSSILPFSDPVKVVCPLKLRQVVCREGIVWALTTDGAVVCRTGISKRVPSGTDWKEVGLSAISAISTIALGAGGTAWIVDAYGTLWFKINVTMDHPDGKDSKWWQIDLGDGLFQEPSEQPKHQANLSPQKLENLFLGHHRACLAAGDPGVWHCTPLGTVLYCNRKNIIGHRWTKVMLKGISSRKWASLTAEGMVRESGSGWGLLSGGTPVCFCLTAQRAMAVSLPGGASSLQCLSATPQTLWALTTEGKVFVRSGIAPQCPTGEAWVPLNLQQLGGIKLVHISCSANFVWACDSNGSVYMRIGGLQPPLDLGLMQAWVQVETGDELPSSLMDKLATKGRPSPLFGQSRQRGLCLIKVYCGPNNFMVWAIDSRKKVYAREGIFPDLPIGVGWVFVPGIEAKQLCISRQSVWAVTPSGKIYRRCGISQRNYVGDYWKKIPGRVMTLSSTADDELLAVSKEGNIHQHQFHVLKFSKGARISSASFSRKDSIDDDWEVV